MKFLYHCFCRLSETEETAFGSTHRVDSGWYQDLCIQILRGILEYGFLLKPEDKELRVHLVGNGGFAPASQHYEQCRCSFTLSEPGKLSAAYPALNKSHRDLFGEIAIAIHPSHGKALGMHPCLYSHDDVKLDSDLVGAPRLDIEPMVNAVNAQFTQVTDVLRLFALIEATSRTAQPEEVKDEIRPVESLTSEMFEIKNPSGGNADLLLEQALSLTPEQARYIIDFTDVYRESMYDLAGKMDIIQSLFQSISASSRGVPFHYYDQQEWRLVRSISEHTVVSCLDVSRDPYNVRDSFDRKYADRAKSHIEKIAESRGRPLNGEIDFSNYWIHWGLRIEAEMHDIFSLIDHIICPEHWYENVSREVSRISCRRGLNRINPIRIRKWEELKEHWT